LAATGLVNLDVGRPSGLDQKGSGRNRDRLGLAVEADDMVRRRATRCSSSRYASTAFM
jgi:hypothetical protein